MTTHRMSDEAKAATEAHTRPTWFCVMENRTKTCMVVSVFPTMGLAEGCRDALGNKACIRVGRVYGPGVIETL